MVACVFENTDSKYGGHIRDLMLTLAIAEQITLPEWFSSVASKLL